MTDPQLPPGMKKGKLIFSVYGMEDEKGDFQGIIIDSTFPKSLLRIYIELVLESLKNDPGPETGGRVIEMGPGPQDPKKGRPN